jgi:hypothetical protein
MQSRGIKKVRDRVLLQYAKSVVEFEVAMSQRRAGMTHDVFDKKMLDWGNSSIKRYAVSRVLALAAFENKPLRKAEIARKIGATYQATSQILQEAVMLNYAVEARKNHFQASEYLIEGCLAYVQERHALISSGLIKNAQIWENFNDIYQVS